MTKNIIFIFLSLFVLQAQNQNSKINTDDRLIYYGIISGLYGLSELIPEHEPWMTSDTLKQQFEAANTIPTPYLVSINVSYFSLMSYSLSNDYVDDPAGLNHTIGHIEALVAQHGVTRLVKKLVARERPNKGKDKVSFWSGHASTAFATATYTTLFINDHSSMSDEGKYAFGILNYAYAGYVGWTRIDDFQHHTSDVIVGAIWGIIASNYIYQIRNNRLHNLYKGDRRYKSSNQIMLNFNFKL